MDKVEDSRPNMEPSDSYDTRQGKQRASVKWLLSKAFNNRVPENLREPFYRDNEEQEHLKPPIIGALANAELYCLALSNMYSDPNYHNLNHWNILQTLARKGIHVADPPDCSLTETVLIQTNPLRMSAHMAVMESLMTLYGREVGTGERVSAAVRRWGGRLPLTLPDAVDAHEDNLLRWVGEACRALEAHSQDKEPALPAVECLRDLCDGAALAALVSLYCPDALPASQIRIPRLSSVHDSVHNLGLVHAFCQRHLPYDVFHMTPEDITYMRGSMHQNLLVMLADLFNVLEIHPAKCVRFSGSQNENSVSRSPSASHMTRGRTSQGGTSQRSACSTPERRSASPQRTSQPHHDRADEGFVVHRGRAVPTLSTVIRHSDDRGSNGDGAAAGRPSNWEEQRRSSYAGRRSRRGSINAADDSQLTVENFGGSQDRLNFLGRNPEKELATVGARHSSPRKISAPAGPVEQTVALRSSVQDARGTIDLFFNDGDSVMHFPNRKMMDPRDVERTEEIQVLSADRRLGEDVHRHSQNVAAKGFMEEDEYYLNNNNISDAVDGDIGDSKISNFADLTKFRSNGDQSGIQLVYMQHREENGAPQTTGIKMNHSEVGNGEKKMTSFGVMPNTTTWQQQSLQIDQHHSNGEGNQTLCRELSPSNGTTMAVQLNNIRMKLEEKRRRIEHEKKRMETALGRQRQQVGQQAFFQAVTKNKGSVVKSPSAGGVGDETAEEESPTPRSVSAPVFAQEVATKLERPVTLQDISTDAQTVESKWMDRDGSPFVETRRTPDLDGMALEDYHQSIAKMNSSLRDIQSDIARLATQQDQIQANQYLQQQIYRPDVQHVSQSPRNQFGSQRDVGVTPYGSQHNFGSSPHIPQRPSTEPPQFFLHDRPQQIHHVPQAPPRRTWAQQARSDGSDRGVWQSPSDVQRYRSPQPPFSDEDPQRGWAAPPPSGFAIHGDALGRSPERHDFSYRNGAERHTPSYACSPPRQSHLALQSLFTQPSPPAARRQQSLDDAVVDSQQRLPSPGIRPVETPAPDDMEPQNISFIGSAEEEALRHGIGRLNITSGNRTYRLPSPTRPSLTGDSFRRPPAEADAPVEKGFYVSFDGERPKRPKPPLRAKRGSPRRDRAPSGGTSPERIPVDDGSEDERQRESPILRREVRVDRAPPPTARENHPTPRAQGPVGDPPTAIVIGTDLADPDPDTAEEMERKKERIMMLSLQRRQAAEEARARSEAAADAKRQREAALTDEKNARKDMQARRREDILQQYKLKKAMEEAEREGKVLDKDLLSALMKPSGTTVAPGGTARLRSKAGAGPRARPKTIHVDSGAVQMAEGMLAAGRARQGSSSNLTAGYSQPPSGQSTMRRDYYRGSQDSLADRAGLYRDSPIDESRGMSPGSGPSALGRRGSYKTSRENVNVTEPQTQTRGRSKYSTYQNNFKAGRKSSSLMNLCDSGLGRATPPRRAPSPGMRTLPSPSGPGSLPPGLVAKRRNFDDGSSDISSTPSSIMDYSGPRLYKQPATKSNRGIMLNAVEYCVFPGAVNKEAKRRVLEEIGRSESKHFLVLFRDAGCQFRALYSYCPDGDEVFKLYGTGPRQVNERMFDKFFKYNSGSKCFSQVHTKHLTVTIDAFTIHNSLWQGKKVQLPSKKDMALVI